jgi:hypothetical protein
MCCASASPRPWQQLPWRLPTTVLLAFICLSMEGNRPAMAGDNKAYPGSMCQRWGNSVADIAAADGSAVRNGSYYDVYTVSCPLVRDNTINTNGTDDAWVYVYRSSYAITPLSCSFLSDRASDGVTVYQYTASTSAVGSAKLIIKVPDSVTPGPYSIRCALPPRSEIYSYIVPEHPWLRSRPLRQNPLQLQGGASTKPWPLDARRAATREIDASQERGEVARARVNQHSREDVQTSDSLGLDRTRVAEW